MFYILAVFLFFLTFGIGSLFLKKHNTRMGHGLGNINSREWGMEEGIREYHE